MSGSVAALIAIDFDWVPVFIFGLGMLIMMMYAICVLYISNNILMLSLGIGLIACGICMIIIKPTLISSGILGITIGFYIAIVLRFSKMIEVCGGDRLVLGETWWIYCLGIIAIAIIVSVISLI